MSDSTPDTDSTESPADAATPTDDAPDIPDWDDEYVDRVSDRLMYNFDLAKDYRVRGEEFTLYGQLLVHSE
jgi:hypothetical protein